MSNGGPTRIHVLAKPTGSACNLACAYCFFLDKELLYPDSRFRMSDEVLEAYIRQLIEAHRSNQVKRITHFHPQGPGLLKNFNTWIHFYTKTSYDSIFQSLENVAHRISKSWKKSSAIKFNENK